MLQPFYELLAVLGLIILVLGLALAVLILGLILIVSVLAVLISLLVHLHYLLRDRRMIIAFCFAERQRIYCFRR